MVGLCVAHQLIERKIAQTLLYLIRSLNLDVIVQVGIVVFYMLSLLQTRKLKAQYVLKVPEVAGLDRRARLAAKSMKGNFATASRSDGQLDLLQRLANGANVELDEQKLKS